MSEEFRIIVNGFQQMVPPNTSIDALIIRFKELDKDLIVERNRHFVHARDYPSTMVEPGDELEFIHPNFGG